MKSRSLTVISIILSLTAIYFARNLVNNLLLALFIVIILFHAKQYLVRKRIPSWLATFSMILVLFGGYFSLAALLGSSISMFIERAPEYGQELSQRLRSFSPAMDSLGLSTGPVVDTLDPTKILSYTADIFSGIGSTVSSELTLILLTIFLMVEADVFKEKIDTVTANNKEGNEYLKVIVKSIRHYLSIKTMTSLMTGLAIGIGLGIIGVDFPILWGLVAFLLNYIPNIGSLIAALPAIALAFIQFGSTGVISTGILYLVANIGIGTILEPKIMGNGLGLSTFVVFAGLLVWGFLLGPNGMFLSVPITISLKIYLEQSESTRPYAILLGTRNDLSKHPANHKQEPTE